MKKWILRSVIIVVVLVIGAVGVTWAMLDSIAKSGIQEGGKYALKVPTDVKDVKLSLIDGTLMIDTLKVGNPEGFGTPHLMQTGRFDLQVRPGSVVSEPIDVQQFVLDGLDVNLEWNAKGNNISCILANVKQTCGGSDSKKDDSPGRKILVGKLVIKNVVAHVRLPVGDQSITIKLPAVELNDVTKDTPEGVTVSQLMGRILPAVLSSIVEKAKEAAAIPAELLAGLNQDLASTAQAMGGQASKLLQQVGGDASALVQQNLNDALKKAGDLQKAVPTKAIEEVGKTITKEVPKDIGKGLGDSLKGVIPGATSKPK